jgi:hypothetical protein
MFQADLKKRRRVAIPSADPETPGIACIGRRGIVLGGPQPQVRPDAGAARATRIQIPCWLEFRACAVSADGRTFATVTGDDGRPARALRFHSTSRMKGRESVALTDGPVTVGLSLSGASAVVTFVASDPVLISRATGSRLKLPLPAP